MRRDIGATSRWILIVYAAALVVVGLSLITGGAYLLYLGGSPYYVLCGLTVVASAILLFQRKSEGAFIYGLMLLATLAWSLWEAGLNGWALMPRVVGPGVMGLVLLIPAIHQTLERKSKPWSPRRCIALTVAAIVVGLGVRAVAPPLMHPDPLYQAGVTTFQTPPTLQTSEPEAPDANAGDWRNFGNDQGGSRFSSLDQITPQNVAGLKMAWTAKVTNNRSRNIASPLKIDRTLYTCTPVNDIIAFDAESGHEMWRFNANSDPRGSTFPFCRGVAYYKTPNATGPCAERIITNTVDARLIAVDAEDGKPCADFGEDGRVSLLKGMGVVDPGYYNVTSAPTIVRGKVVLGGRVADNQYWGEPSGVIRAFDAVTGKLVWAWDMGQPDRKGEPPDGESYTRSTPNSWAPMSADDKLGIVYVPTGSATPDHYGAQRRPFDEKYGSSIVALDAESGDVRWSFQTVHHDVWDLDVASQPSLVDVPTANGPVPAVVAPTKQGELYILNRLTGEPIFPVKEIPVPTDNGAPGDWYAPTQPHSVGVPSFRGPVLTEGSMWGITPLDQLWCRVKFREARHDSFFPPPSDKQPIIGLIDIMGWGSAAVDTSRNVAIINNSMIPNYTLLISRAEAEARGIKVVKNLYHVRVGQRDPQGGTPFALINGRFMSPLDVPCPQPPYGRLNAVDLNTGKLIWTQIFGLARELGPLGIKSHLPIPLGTFSTGGAVVTKSGITFIAASQDATLRAFETTTGKLLWETRLPGGGSATPITYISPESGRQFIAISVSGNDSIVKGNGDYIVAYALPINDTK